MNRQDEHGQNADEWTTLRADWAKKAELYKPAIHETICRPVCLVKAIHDDTAFQNWRLEKCGEISELASIPFRQIRETIVDFGRHLTGHFSFFPKTFFSEQDAPIRLKFTFGEVPSEINTPFDPFPGALSRGWLQDEIVTVPYVDTEITISRRLAFRYVKIELLGTPAPFDFVFADLYCKATTSTKPFDVQLAAETPAIIRDINRVGLETLKECMQTVYEDGPKRDQRLWIGDLYLESLANNYSFRQHDLTKRCLYLLASLAKDDGRLHATVFEQPYPHAQVMSFCMDYSLLYNVALLEYFKATGDKATAEDLWPVADHQIKNALTYLDDDLLFDANKKGKDLWLFFDWRVELNKSVAMQGVTILALDKSAELAQALGHAKKAEELAEISAKMKAAARANFYDVKKQCFVTKPDGQVSYLSQAWMILAGVVSKDEGAKAMQAAFADAHAVYPGAPYAYHYVIEALIQCGMDEEARTRLTQYWGAMIQRGADTFWEVYDPNDELASPYNFYPINSYCHAWSCTPVYFINKYPEIFQR